MSKNYNEITSQCAVIKNETTTLSFYPNVTPVPVERFKEIYEGKIKIVLYDFSRGKGDNGVSVYYNLDMDDFEYLYERAKQFNLPQPFSGNKIMGNWPEKNGRYAGLCPVTKLYITRNETNSKGELMRNPWSITISNGYAQAARGKKPGTFYEKPKTFQETGRARMMLTDQSFLYCMKKIKQYLNVSLMLIGSQIIPQGQQMLEEKYNSREYNESIVPFESPEARAPAGNIQNREPVVQNEPQRQNANIEIHPTLITVTSEFQALDNVYIASCRAGGNDYIVYFPNVLPELIESKNKLEPVRVNLYMADGKFWFHSLANAA